MCSTDKLKAEGPFSVEWVGRDDAGQDGLQLFSMKVTGKGGANHVIKRRFTCFQHMDEQYRPENPNLPPLPPKGFFRKNLNPNFMKDREAALKQLVLAAVQIDPMAEKDNMKSFLGLEGSSGTTEPISAEERPNAEGIYTEAVDAAPILERCAQRCATTRTVLLLNGGAAMGASKGSWNDSLIAKANEVFAAAGWNVLQSKPIDGYDIPGEVEKLKSADLLVFAYPIWWFGVPWHMKKWIDEVISSSYGVLFGGDGRTHVNPDALYGSGGLAHGKHYLCAVSWNAPERAFSVPGDFFDGHGLEITQMQVQKTFQFIGFQRLPTFGSYDTMKNPDYPSYEVEFVKHLERYTKNITPEAAKTAQEILSKRAEQLKASAEKGYPSKA